MSPSPFGPEMSGPRRRRRRVAKGVLVALVSLAMVAIGVTLPSQAASAAGTASVSISPATTTVAAGASTTMTLSISCSVTGGCADTTLTFPVTSYTDLTGATVNDSTRFGVLSCTGWTRTVTATVVTYTYTGGTPAGTLATGTQQCTFVYGTKNYTTPNGQAFSVVPTINGSNFTSSTGDAATITTTAAPSVTFTKTTTLVNSNVGQGGQFVYDLHFNCTANNLTGAIGTSSFTVVDPLPANFTYQSYETWYNANNGNYGVGVFPGTITFDAESNTLTYSDPDGTICAGANNSPGRDIRITGTASTAGVPDGIGETISNTATATFDYLDGTSGSIPASTASNVVAVVPTPFEVKGSTSQALGNLGEYRYPPNNGAYRYTYPGDWNGSGQSAQYTIYLTTNGTQAGASFAVQDPLPCATNNASPGTSANPNYASNAPGTLCTDPAFIPTVITATGFTPTVSDEVTVIHADGSTASIAYTSGTGWVIPAAPAVSEIDFPAFAEEGQNSAARMQLTILGYAAADLAVPSIMTNTATANAYLVGSDEPLAPQETASAILMVAPADEPSGTVVQPGIWPRYSGGDLHRDRLDRRIRGQRPAVQLHRDRRRSVPSDLSVLPRSGGRDGDIRHVRDIRLHAAELRAAQHAGRRLGDDRHDRRDRDGRLQRHRTPAAAVGHPRRHHHRPGRLPIRREQPARRPRGRMRRQLPERHHDRIRCTHHRVQRPRWRVDTVERHQRRPEHHQRTGRDELLRRVAEHHRRPDQPRLLGGQISAGQPRRRSGHRRWRRQCEPGWRHRRVQGDVHQYG
ncbi:hypothetical protein GCM10025881_29130 [Pseudolysinimonas kribbensis]|uniref:Uncharacterized protein n=1 Tax=Pseudolysinimonas kribbensis TaxID=433641 RepID=A0ABQ6K6S5_9MICO|nr:hypothetical protein [Pseudolysinimonas kribbensis]GMA96089.1 hypothetical protein GCM10025881_29130 [Pseudolysinimonas kribbensis]